MKKVRLKITPELAVVFNAPGFDWVVLDKEVSDGATIGDLLAALAGSYRDFRKALLDPETGELADQVNIVLNDTLLQTPDLSCTRLNDGDIVIFLPVFAGG